MSKYRIALIPGDGIGQEVLPEGVRVLERARERLGGFDLEMERFEWGCDHHDRHGAICPADYLDVLRTFDAILLGAMGYPERLPDHVTLAPLIGLRQRFDQYACVRPARLWPGVRSPLAQPGKIDMIVVRENSEGEYLDVGGRTRTGEPHEVAVQTAVHTRRGVERIIRFAFGLAMARQKRLTLVTKSNAMAYGMVLWDQTLEAVGADFPEVETNRLHVDRACMDLVRRPGEFDVLVASNLFGDILTDLSGAVTGSLGLNPSSNINPPRDFPSMFEPVHGSAPDIFGRGIANPVAMILSVGMMLDWLDEKPAADAVRSAVESALSAGHATPDLGGSLSTKELADRIVERV